MRLWPEHSRHPVLWTLLWSAVVGCLTMFAVLFWFVRTEHGLRYTERGLERLVSDNIPGLMEIGKLEELGFSRIVVSDLRFFHTDGRCLLFVKHAVVTPDWDLALRGMVAFRRAEADGGFFVISTDPDGRLSFEAAVNAPHQPGQPNDPYGGVFYSMRNIHVQHLTVHAKLSDEINYKVKDVSGFVGVLRVDTPATQVVLDHIRGEIEPEIAGAKVALKDLSGWVHGKVREVVRMHADLRVGDGELSVQFGYFDRESDKVKIRVDKSRGAEAVAMAWLARALASFSSDLTVEG